MNKLMLTIVASLCLVANAGNIAEWKSAEEWFSLARYDKFDVYQQEQAIMAAIMLKMETVAAKLNLECDVNGAYYFQYADKPHQGAFWTKAWRGRGDDSKAQANRTCLEYIYRELDRFVKESSNSSHISYEPSKPFLNDKTWMNNSWATGGQK